MPEQQLRHIRDITLTDTERAVLRHTIHAFAIANPMTASFSVRSWHWALRHGALALGLALILVAGGTGVSAERSHPGDLLYQFRLTVNDRIETALAFNDDARVDVEMSQLQRLLDEEDAVRDDELTALAFEAAADGGEDFEDEIDRELREIERELEAQTQEAEEFSDDNQDSDETEIRDSSRTSDALDTDEFEDELWSIERELQEEERSQLELE